MRLRALQISADEVLPRRELFARIDRAGPGFGVQLRDPQLSGRALFALGEELRRRTAAVGAWLVVNDRLDVALALGSDGLHLGRVSLGVAAARRLWPGWISRSAHSLAEALAAGEDGADAVLLSPIFASPGKGPALGVGALGEARARLPAGVALFALGGVDAGNARSCLAAGADGLAAIRADLTALDGARPRC